MFFMGSLYMQQVLGYDALEIGLAFLPTTLAMGIMSIRFSDRLINRFGPKNVLIPGLTLIGLGLALFTNTPVDGVYLENVLPPMLLLGIGAGSSFTALMTLAMSGATQEDAGLASGLVNTTAQVGAALGLAVLATLSATRTENLIADGTSEPAGARQRLSPRVLDRRRAGRHRHRGRRDRGRGTRRGARDTPRRRRATRRARPKGQREPAFSSS